METAKLLKSRKSSQTNSAKKIAKLTSIMADMPQKGAECDWVLWNNMKKELKDAAYKQEEKFRSQKASQNWLRNGDKNTKFF